MVFLNGLAYPFQYRREKKANKPEAPLDEESPGRANFLFGTEGGEGWSRNGRYDHSWKYNP